jgi:hypothetical protein
MTGSRHDICATSKGVIVQGKQAYVDKRDGSKETKVKVRGRVTACLMMTDRKLGAKWATIPDWELIGNAAGDGGFRFHDAAI